MSVGYVQGMSDLLSPIVIVMDDEVDAFWCFVGFMSGRVVRYLLYFSRILTSTGYSIASA